MEQHKGALSVYVNEKLKKVAIAVTTNDGRHVAAVELNAIELIDILGALQEGLTAIQPPVA